MGSGFLFHHFLTNADAGKEIRPRSSYEKLESSKADLNRFALEGCVPCAVSNKRGNPTHTASKQTQYKIYPNEIVTIYEGWNFNSGNYLFTTDTK